MQTQSSVKYTAILPTDCINALKVMARERRIPSVNQGIRQAVEVYVATHKREQYEKDMLSAAQDPAFMQRTMDTQAAFAFVDGEELGTW